jgi:hypothetical protein
MNTLYKDKNWLYNKYCKEKLSIRDIGKMLNVYPTIIKRWLIYYNIPIRTRKEASHIRQSNHFTVTKQFEDWLSGEMMGDGCIQSYSDYSAKITYASKYLEYIDYISGTLDNFGIKQSGHIYKRDKGDGWIAYQYQSKRYEELKSFHSKWYCNGKKRIPSDLELTPIILRQWYIGDGNLHKSRRNISLATNCFTENELDFLINLFKNLDIIATKMSQNCLYISTKSVKQFLDYIGECPVSCYEYKWDMSSQN